ncbi:MAG: DUF1631 family protein [Pseudomonadota bacterium]|nr:DUF1631 family protein [Pseudomonadota bacterium]
MASSRPSSATHVLAQQARELFVEAVEGAVPDIAAKAQRHLSTQAETGRFASAEQARTVLDTADAFRRERTQWASDVCTRWRAALTRSGATASSDLGALSLVDDEVVERKIIASRLGASVSDAAGNQFNDLRLRIQALERTPDLSPKDVLRPETLAQILVQAWTDRGLTRPMWAFVHDEVASVLAPHMASAYEQINAFLVQQGVEAEIDMRSRMRRGDDGTSDGGAATPDAPPARATPPGTRAGQPGGYTGHAHDPAGGATGMGGARPVPAGHMEPGRHGAHTAHAGHAGDMPTGYTRHDMSTGYTRAGSLTGYTGERSGPMTQTPFVRHSALARAEQETRMVTGLSPMARMRQRAQGVLGQLRRLVSDRVADFDTGAPAGPASPQLAQALAEPAVPFAVTEWIDRPSTAGGVTAPMPAATPANVQLIATQLRQRAAELKAKTDKPSEKATIEIVALMFQAILAEERIPAAIRVWFARLQIPVLRLALAEPDFFASVEHPARQLIDRMGACVLGFDGSQMVGSRLEREIKRIVQVIEQYPETGRRVYQLVLDEFRKFLGRSLTENSGVRQAATLAQQVEQKEALSIQYTIELRRMLQAVPVPEDVREFLFRIWSEVLALSAVRRGAHDAETLRFKKAAADLLWAVSPKPDRAERARVVQQLPGVLATLREGMGLLAYDPHEQDGHIKLINDAVMHAFVSRDEGLPQHQLDELARGLAGLEDVVTDDPEGDMLLDPGMIELMSGVEGSALEVIATGGSQPTEGMLQWARVLEAGSWFTLDHDGSFTQVQYVWRSARGQLHLLSAGAGRSYLVQTRRLAAYLQAGLLVPVEDEALTVRATREALAKLHGQPEQLLQ